MLRPQTVGCCDTKREINLLFDAKCGIPMVASALDSIGRWLIERRVCTN